MIHFGRPKELLWVYCILSYRYCVQPIYICVRNGNDHGLFHNFCKQPEILYHSILHHHHNHHFQYQVLQYHPETFWQQIHHNHYHRTFRTTIKFYNFTTDLSGIKYIIIIILTINIITIINITKLLFVYIAKILIIIWFDILVCQRRHFILLIVDYFSWILA